MSASSHSTDGAVGAPQSADFRRSARGRWLRRLAWLCVGFTVFVLVLWGVLTALMLHWVAEPPPLPRNTSITQEAPTNRGDRVYVGRSWLGRREGLPVLYLTGTPFEMGYANSALTQTLVRRQEEMMLELFYRVAPYRWTQFALKFVVVYKNRYLPQHVIAEHQSEILGLAFGCPDIHPEMGPYYHRLLNYHAAQDISYMMMNNPLIRGGCTAFGAWGASTRDGHLLLGRNFDWEAHPVFDEDRIVILCEPKDGIPFISLAWAGMVGCVSGMNREGVSVTVNGAPSRLPDDAATPTCLVAREVLQRAKTLAEAVEIVRRRQVFVSALFLVGSRKDGRFVVIERTPNQTVVREPGSESHIVCANLYRSPELEADEMNQRMKRVDTSVPRYDRANELLVEARGALDPARCVTILRDRRLPGGQFPGNGHRSSLNPLIATHSAVMDLTAGLFWAALPPHQLGRFVAFDVNDWEKALPDQALPEDPLLARGEYKRYQAARAKLEAGLQDIKRQRPDEALVCAQEAETNNPGFYRNAWLEAESLFRLGRLTNAAQACQSALAGKPALEGERLKLEQLARDIAAAQAQDGMVARPR